MKLSDIFSNYFEVRTEMTDGTRSLSEEQLAWTAPNHKNSIGYLLAHIAEAEYWWVTIVALKKESSDDYSSDRFEKKMPSEAIFSLLDEYLAETKSFLESHDSDDWDKISYKVPGRDKSVSLRWLAWHVVEHQARHRGQIFMLMRMQGLNVPHV